MEKDGEYTGCYKGNLQYFSKGSLRVNYIEITKNTYI
jgi:hypothetical protein